jgi:hypothetical protein
LKDISGQRFGKLIAISPTTGRDGSAIIWYCQCDCGNEAFVSIKHLPGQMSCGCLRLMSPLPEGEAALNGIYNSYKQRTRKRGIPFLLSKEEFTSLINQNCAYCGALPSNVFKGKGLHGDYIYSGIDRVDNSHGYTEDNCVPCCKLCNAMKEKLAASEFLAQVKRIYEHTNRII